MNRQARRRAARRARPAPAPTLGGAKIGWSVRGVPQDDGTTTLVLDVAHDGGFSVAIPFSPPEGHQIAQMIEGACARAEMQRASGLIVPQGFTP